VHYLSIRCPELSKLILAGLGWATALRHTPKNEDALYAALDQVSSNNDVPRKRSRVCS